VPFSELLFWPLFCCQLSVAYCLALILYALYAELLSDNLLVFDTMVCFKTGHLLQILFKYYQIQQGEAQAATFDFSNIT